MGKVTLSDITKRYKNHTILESAQYSQMHENIYERALEHNNLKDIIYCIENWNKLSGNIDFRVSKVIALFESMVDIATPGQVIKYGNWINEEAVPKVRDAKQTQTYLKRKLSQVKTKISTKINNNIGDAKDFVKNQLDGMKSNVAKNTAPIKDRAQSAINKVTKKDQDTDKKEKVVTEVYEKMIATLEMCRNCDRILENYNNLSMRYNIDKIIVENTQLNDVKDTVNELCKFIDTYTMPNKVKLNSVLESAWYGFSRNHIEFEASDIINTACDYFLFKEDGMNICKSILSAAVLYDDEDDMKDVEFITEEEPETNCNESHKYGYFIKEDSVENKEEPETDFDKIFNDFKASEDGEKENKLSSLITRLYSKKPDEVINGTPNLLSWIRYVFIVGVAASCPIGPIIAAVSLIADYATKSTVQRDDIPKMLAAFKAEKTKSVKKFESTKSTEEKARLTKYIESIDDAIEKIDEHYESILSDEEVDAKYEAEDKDDTSSFDFGTSSNSGDFDFGDDDFDDDFDFNLESVHLMGIIPKLEIATNKFIQLKETDILGIIESRINILSYDILEATSMICTKYPTFIDVGRYRKILETAIYETRKGHTEYNRESEKFARLSEYSDALRSIKVYNNKNKFSVYDEYFKFNYYNTLVEVVCEVDTLYNNYSPVLEFSFTNTIKLASEKLKKAFTKLSDKEKTVSKNIDVSMNNFTKSVEKSLTNDNRESIIKGSILPSASKMIKSVLAAGVTTLLVGPIVAIIGVLGYIGCSAKYKSKERQMVIDEIEIEQKMVEKYIDIAESKNDMKALKELLTIQRNLERQHGRIKYKMQVEFGQKVYDKPDTNGYS